MNNSEQSIKAMAREATMTAEEKAAVRRSVVSYVESNPIVTLPVSEPVLSPYQPKESFFSIFRERYIPVALIAVLFLGSAVSAAADQTLPGDPLYFVKTGINENVKAWLAFSDQSKVALEAQIAETRLEEAEKLASADKLSPEVKSDLEANFQEHADNFEQNVQALQSQGQVADAASASSQFESSLNAHEDVLRSISQDGTTTAPLADAVGAEAADVSDVRASLEDQVKDQNATTTQSDAEDALAEATDDAGTLSATFEAAKPTLSQSVLGEITTQLALASTTVALGNDKMAAGDFANAFILYQKAHRIVFQINTALGAASNLNLTVNPADVIPSVDSDGTSTPDLADASTTLSDQGASSTVAVSTIDTLDASSTDSTDATSTDATDNITASSTDTDAASGTDLTPLASSTAAVSTSTPSVSTASATSTFFDKLKAILGQ